jgi:hypothetical protein
MSQSLTINDREYIPAGDVGKHFGYTRDYILTLTREKKIDGQKIGHRWYVNLESAEKFFELAKVEREARRQEVSTIRKAELKSYTPSVQKTSRESNALVETFAIAFIGILIGVTGYVGTSVQQQALLGDSDFSFLKTLAISFYDLVSPSPAVVVSEPSESSVANSFGDTAATPSIENPVAYDDLVATTTYTSLVVGSDQVLTTTTIQTIRESFSDDVSVSVDPHNPDSGVIIPHFKNKDGNEYRFLMVPVTPEDNS